MRPPSFRVASAAASAVRHFATQIEHGLAIGVQSLAGLQPSLLRLMLLKHFHFSVNHLVDSDSDLRRDELAEGISIAVGLGVVDRQISVPGLAGWF